MVGYLICTILVGFDFIYFSRFVHESSIFPGLWDLSSRFWSWGARKMKIRWIYVYCLGLDYRVYVLLKRFDKKKKDSFR